MASTHKPECQWRYLYQGKIIIIYSKVLLQSISGIIRMHDYSCSLGCDTICTIKLISGIGDLHLPWFISTMNSCNTERKTNAEDYCTNYTVMITLNKPKKYMLKT